MSSWLVFASLCVMGFTINSELDPPGGLASSVGRHADELSTLVPRRRVDEEAAIRIQEEVWTTQVQQRSLLQKYITTGIFFLDKTLLTQKTRSGYTKLLIYLL